MAGESFRARVRPLPWKPRQQDKRRIHTAITVAGIYDVMAWGSNGMYEVEIRAVRKLPYGLGVYETCAEAKAVCQRDHNERVMALLEVEESNGR
jgi:hypothetical protein